MKYLLSVLFLLVSSESFAQMPPPPAPALIPMITIMGEAKETVAPDQAIITATLTSREQKLDVAKKNNDAQMEKIVQIAKQFSSPKEKIAPSNLNINPEYTYNNATNKQEMIGYIVNRTLRITMDKLDVHERVLAALVDAGIDQVSGVEFTVANPEAISDRLRIKALENAKAKASALAATVEADRELTRVAVFERLKAPADGGADPYQHLLRQAVAELLREGQSRGEVTPGLDLDLWSGVIAGLYFQQILEWCAATSPYPLAERLERLLAGLWHGLSLEQPA